MTPEQEQIITAHGTLKEFSDAVWAACEDLFITRLEAMMAIEKYKMEWEDAGKA